VNDDDDDKDLQEPFTYTIDKNNGALKQLITKRVGKS